MRGRRRGGHGPGPRGRRRPLDALRGPAMLWPYVALIGGTLLLARASRDTLAQFWWLAPACAVLYVVVLSLTVTSMATRSRRARARDRELELLSVRLKSAIGAPPPERGSALEPVMGRLPEVQRACAEHLSAAQSETVRAALVELGAHDALAAQLRRARAKRARAKTLFTIGWLADDRSVPALANALNGRDADLAYVAGQALAEYESAQACHALVTALQTGTISRPLVATLLESSRYGGAPELVAAASGDPDARVRGWVAFLLGRCADPRTREWLVPLAADEDAEVRAAAAEAYAAFPEPQILTALLRDEDWRVRAGAAKAIGDAGLSGLVSELTALMSDGAWWVRQRASTALKQLGQASVGHLRRLLEDDDRFVRNKAAEILIEIGFISDQIAALRGTPEQVAAARHVLAALVRAEARETLVGSIEAADPVTRERLVALLDEVDNTSAAVRLAA